MTRSTISGLLKEDFSTHWLQVYSIVRWGAERRDLVYIKALSKYGLGGINENNENVPPC